MPDPRAGESADRSAGYKRGMRSHDMFSRLTKIGTASLFAAMLVLSPTPARAQDPNEPVPATWPEEAPIPPPEPVFEPVQTPPPPVAHPQPKPKPKPAARKRVRPRHAAYTAAPRRGPAAAETYVAPGAGANWRPRWWPSWLPAGSGRAAVLVSVGRNRAYVHDGKRLWTHFPVATGKDFATPRGSFRVVNKTLSPSWTYKDKHVPGGTYANPLGVAWLGLSMPAGWGRYPIGLHGTNAPWSIGYRVSRGCVRMRNADILTVYKHVPVGSPVWIVW